MRASTTIEVPGIAACVLILSSTDGSVAGGDASGLGIISPATVTETSAIEWELRPESGGALLLDCASATPRNGGLGSAIDVH